MGHYRMITFKCTPHAYLLLAMICTILFYPMTSHAQKKKKDNSILNNLKVVELTVIRDDILLDIYARMMRYQTAAQDYYNYSTGTKASPTQYLTIGIKNMNYGNIVQLHKNVKAVINQKTDKIINLRRHEMCYDEDVCHIMYEAGWAHTFEAGYGSGFAAPALDNVKEYTTYDVTIKYQGKQLSYSGMVLYYEFSNGEMVPEMIDPVIPMINRVFADKMPAIRSPWDNYVSSPVYGKIVNGIREKKTKKGKLIPEDAPIGYLPGDDEKPDQYLLMAAEGCVDDRKLNGPECDEFVQDMMSEIWNASSAGEGNEVCFSLIGTPNNYSIGPLKTENNKEHCNADLSIGGVKAWAIIHVHPNDRLAPPSVSDRSDAEKYDIIYYTITNRGLYQYVPAPGSETNGAMNQLTTGLEWLHSCYP